MKELTIEQKAKRYDEAFEKAKNYHSPETVCNVRIAMENLFPELKESEDERIRKEMIEILKKEAHDFPSSVIAEKSNSWLAWLEKQGENAYNKELSELLHKVICRFINDLDIPYSDREKVSMKVLPYVERLEKQGEQC